VARLIRARKSGLPSDRHPDRTKRAVVLGAVKVWPSEGGVRRKVGATANLDSSCARRLCNTAGRGEETGLQVKQRNRSRKKDAPLRNRLTKKTPYKACSGFTHVTAHRIAQPPKATFVTRLQPFRSPG
jgi:hypothetical protein